MNTYLQVTLGEGAAARVIYFQQNRWNELKADQKNRVLSFIVGLGQGGAFANRDASKGFYILPPGIKSEGDNLYSYKVRNLADKSWDEYSSVIAPPAQMKIDINSIALDEVSSVELVRANSIDEALKGHRKREIIRASKKIEAEPRRLNEQEDIQKNEQKTAQARQGKQNKIAENNKLRPKSPLLAQQKNPAAKITSNNKFVGGIVHAAKELEEEKREIEKRKKQVEVTLIEKDEELCKKLQATGGDEKNLVVIFAKLRMTKASLGYCDAEEARKIRELEEEIALPAMQAVQYERVLAAIEKTLKDASFWKQQVSHFNLKKMPDGVRQMLEVLKLKGSAKDKVGQIQNIAKSRLNKGAKREPATKEFYEAVNEIALAGTFKDNFENLEESSRKLGNFVQEFRATHTKPKVGLFAQHQRLEKNGVLTGGMQLNKKPNAKDRF